MSIEASLNRFSVVFLCFMSVVLIVSITMTPIMPPVPWVRFPTARHLEIRPLYESDITVSVRQDGTLYLAESWVRPGDLTRGLRRGKARRDDAEVCVRVDREAPFGQVRLVVIAAREAGYRRITFLIDPAKD